jgi:hypothetical protein
MTACIDLPPEWQLKQLVQRYLATVPHKAGETVQLGWFIFRIVESSIPPEVESLDFRKMASFTTDFSAAEGVRSLQLDILNVNGVSQEPCTLCQSALVSRSYIPGREDAFLERQSPCGGSDSGWYVGVLAEENDLDDANSFELRSLYELSIADDRMTPYWLLPVGKIVTLATGDVT